MKIKISYIAKVNDIEFALEGLTVIAGRNATGKSTISRVLMTYFTLLRRMEIHIRHARMNSIGKVIGEMLSPNGVYRWRTGNWWRFIDDGDDALSGDFWNNSEKVSKLIMNLSRRDSRHFHVFDEAEVLTHNNSVIPEEKLRQLRESVLKTISTKDDEYEEFIYRTMFNKVFSGQVNSLSHPDKPATITIKDSDGDCVISLPRNGSVVLPQRHISAFRMVSYLGPTHMLDVIDADAQGKDVEDLMDSYDSGDGAWSKILVAKWYDSQLSFEDDRDVRKALSVLERIGNILHGKLVDANEDIKFKEDGYDTPIELKNLASGVKSIGMVIKAIENGSLRGQDLFIIDEPESNLHPEWQVRFAELLVLLQKELGITVLINTHSPYFLKAIERFSKKYEVFECAHYYFMEEKEHGAGAFGREITSDLSVAYETLYRPLAGLMEA